MFVFNQEWSPSHNLKSLKKKQMAAREAMARQTVSDAEQSSVESSVIRSKSLSFKCSWGPFTYSKPTPPPSEPLESFLWCKQCIFFSLCGSNVCILYELLLRLIQKLQTSHAKYISTVFPSNNILPTFVFTLQITIFANANILRQKTKVFPIVWLSVTDTNIFFFFSVNKKN